MTDISKQLNNRFAEVSFNGESYAVILHESWEAEGNRGEQEFYTMLSPDMRNYINEWVQYGKVIF